jgi:predicted metal-dependent phosphoesterase TrpH
LIDLHTHTTASDGRCTPSELVARAADAGVTVLSVTDHDTTAGIPASAEACAAAGIAFVPGIEITAVADEADVHVLGYFVDVWADALQAFLAAQRRSRVDRVRRMAGRLASAGITLDVEAILSPSVDDQGKAPGRPWIARALVEGGYVADVAEAFDRWLARGRPGFVARTGVSPRDVFAIIHAAGGVASLAHPALLEHDDWIPGFAAAGLDALEAYHSDQDEVATSRYLDAARRLGLVVTGGSDFHDDASHGARGPGSVSLPRDQYDRLVACASARRSTSR